MGTKRKLGSEDAAAPAPAPKRATRACTTNDTQKNPTTTTTNSNNYPANTAVKRASLPPSSSSPPDMQPQLDRIAAASAHHQTMTPFQERVLRLLCQVPRGRVTTYGLLSAHLRASPRAVGSALRRNPFAPQVPCHRVVAAGGALGGFKGQWRSKAEGAGAEDDDAVGRALKEKRALLRGEGVKFDGATGRVVGTPFGAFV